MSSAKFVICIDNRDYEASLERWKVYEVVKDEKAVTRGFIRVIDESDEDYLYPSDFFAEVHLPETVREALIADRYPS